jgi:DNA-directed RNA polymerase subunit beta
MRRIRKFGKNGDTADVPGLASVQTDAYGRFLQEGCLPQDRQPFGLEGLFREFFPIEVPGSGLRVEYLGYSLGSPIRDVDECRDLGLTYASSIHVRLRTVGAESVEEDVYLCDLPNMIGTGDFVINGSERVIVAQIQRSPGIDFSETSAVEGRSSYSCRFVPERGTWVEFTVSRRNVLQVRLGRSGRMPATWLLRAILPQASTNAQILSLFHGVESVDLTGADPVGAIEVRHLADDIVNQDTGEVVAAAGMRIGRELAGQLVEAGIEELVVLKQVDDTLLIDTLEADPSSDHADALCRIYSRFRPGEPTTPERAAAFFAERFANPRAYSLGKAGRFRVNRKLKQDVPAECLTLCPEDILNAVSYLISLRRGDGAVDDIDHLGNRVLRTIDKLLEERLRDAFVRWHRQIAEQLASANGRVPAPRTIASTRAISSAVEEFFRRGELSQVVDQTNPLAELNHIRRVSALGPGGLNRKRAGFEVRDVHASHYGRICPIETPEGPNIGLIASLGLFAKVDDHGFITTPYYTVNGEGASEGPRYYRADEEEGLAVAPVADKTSRDDDDTVVRQSGEFHKAKPSDIDLRDVSPKQMVGISASLIPFLEHNDANRALMGSNMQRQAVPLLSSEQPLVGTGMEAAIAQSSGMVISARQAGVVDEVDGAHIRIGEEYYDLRKFSRLNENTCQNQRPLVRVGESVEAGQIIADGAGTCDGELSLGRNVLVAFMVWGGYNFEDAIIISESLVEKDKYTSIHVEEFTAELRETQLGPEEFSRDIPNVPERMLSRLDGEGIVSIGSRIEAGDILVGKVAPKSKTELTPEEKLLREIFGAAGIDVTNESLTVPPGTGGVVIGTRRYQRRARRSESERADNLKESRRIRVEYSSHLAECISALAEDLGRFPTEGSLSLPQPDDTPTAKDWINWEEGFRFDPMVFAFDIREDARRKYLAHSATIEALKSQRDQILRKLRSGDELPSGVLEIVKIYVAVKRPLSTGDKMAGRHGNKGVIARVVPKEDMPFLADGTPVEMILNPLGVPSRMNVGQILETHLGWAGSILGFRAVSPVFDGATEEDIRACMREAGLPEDGKADLYDGRTGEPFAQKVTVGSLYMLKLNHLVDEKIHARATGPYSLITQQPLGGKARRGGQRLGEMEVWAIEAYGAAYTLQEMLTVKSDDLEGRAQMYESIVKGRHLLHAGTPLSFDVLTQEMRGLGLNLQLNASSDAARQSPHVEPIRLPEISAETVGERR